MLNKLSHFSLFQRDAKNILHGALIRRRESDTWFYCVWDSTLINWGAHYSHHFSVRSYPISMVNASSTFILILWCLLWPCDFENCYLYLCEELTWIHVWMYLGIEANGESYSLTSIKEAIKEATGFTPFIECNNDSSGNSQLYQVYLCVDTSASNFIECPVFPSGKCDSQIEFPSF